MLLLSQPSSASLCVKVNSPEAAPRIVFSEADPWLQDYQETISSTTNELLIENNNNNSTSNTSKHRCYPQWIIFLNFVLFLPILFFYSHFGRKSFAKRPRHNNVLGDGAGRKLPRSEWLLSQNGHKQRMR